MATRRTPQENEAIIRRIAQEVGVDPNLAVAVARQESGLDNTAHNPNGEDSWGLFQGNRRGGMGTGYTPEQLMDPEFNARLMLTAMAETQKRTGLTGGQLAAASQRPADPQGYARSVNAMLAGARGLPHTGSPFSPNPQGAPQGASAVADTPEVVNARSQRDEIQARLNANKAKLEASRIVQDWIDAGDVRTPQWIASRPGMTEAKLDEALAALGMTRDTTNPESVLPASIKDLDKAVKDDEEALGKARSALAKAEGDAAAAANKSGGPGSSTEEYLTNPDGTVRMGADGKPMKNPNFRAPAGSDGNRVLSPGSVLVGPDGQTIFTAPQAPDRPDKPTFTQVDLGTQVVILQDGREVTRFTKQQDVKYGVDPSTGATYVMNADGTPGQKVFDGKANLTTVTRDGMVTGVRQDPDGTLSTTGTLDLRTDAERAKEAAWKKIQDAIRSGATPQQVQNLIAQEATSLTDYVATLTLQRQQQADIQARATAEMGATGELRDLTTGAAVIDQATGKPALTAAEARARRQEEAAAQQRAEQARQQQYQNQLALEAQKQEREKLAQETTSNVMGSAIFTTGGPVRPGQTQVNLPHVPGNPNESIGTRLLREKGLWIDSLPQPPAPLPVSVPQFGPTGGQPQPPQAPPFAPSTVAPVRPDLIPAFAGATTGGV